MVQQGPPLPCRWQAGAACHAGLPAGLLPQLRIQKLNQQTALHGAGSSELLPAAVVLVREAPPGADPPSADGWRR